MKQLIIVVMLLGGVMKVFLAERNRKLGRVRWASAKVYIQSQAGREVV